MKTREVKRIGYTAIYNVYEEGIDYEPTDDFALLEMLARYELHDGYNLWQVGASYSRNMKPSFYYVVSATKAGAQQKFRNAFSWLNIILCVEPLLPDAAEEVLSSPARYIVV